MMTQKKQIVEAVLGAISSADTEKLSTLITKDVIFDAKGTSLFSAKRDYDAVMTAAMGIKQMTKGGLIFNIVSMTEEGNRVACECQGEAELVTGETYNNVYFFLFTFRGDQVAHVNEYFDTKLADERLAPFAASA